MKQKPEPAGRRGPLYASLILIVRDRADRDFDLQPDGNRSGTQPICNISGDNRRLAWACFLARASGREWIGSG